MIYYSMRCLISCFLRTLRWYNGSANLYFASASIKILVLNTYNRCYHILAFHNSLLIVSIYSNTESCKRNVYYLYINIHLSCSCTKWNWQKKQKLSSIQVCIFLTWPSETSRPAIIKHSNSFTKTTTHTSFFELPFI